MTVVVFLGPSLPLDEAAAVFPDALYLPPAGQADLISVLDRRPSAIALVDGEFHQRRSVWHKEILLAMDRGVHVFGSSSMGALRAAELEPYGMVGIGTVFAGYASGELVDDDEVALLYHGEDRVYRHLSEPMVNIRATMDAAERSGIISDEIRRMAVNEAKSLHYADRSRPAVLERLRIAGVPSGHVVDLDEFWRVSAVDVKAADARVLLRTLRGFAADPPPPRAPSVEVARTAALNVIYERERRVRVNETEIPIGDIADFVHLHHPAAETLNAVALDRALVQVLAELVRITPDEADVEQELSRWRGRHGLGSDSDLADWLDRNHLTVAELRELAARTARRRALRRWLIYSRRSEGTARLVLDQLRWDGDYERWAANAANSHRAATTAGDVTGTEHLDALALEHRRWTGASLGDDLAAWAEESGFSSPEHLRAALTRARAGRRCPPDGRPAPMEPTASGPGGSGSDGLDPNGG